MLIEYYDEFQDSIDYPYINSKTLKLFEQYIKKNNISLEDAFFEVNTFGDTLPVTARTKRNYQTRLRRLIEYVCKKKGVHIRGEIIINKEGEYDSGNNLSSQ